MQRKTIHKWVLIAWFMLWGSVLSVAFAQNYGSPYRGSSFPRVVVCPTVRSVMEPAYQFQSTSAYTFGVGSAYESQITEPFSAAPANSGIRRGFGDPDDDENGIGEIPDPVPVGEPFVLLLMAILYLLFRKLRPVTHNP